MRSVLATLNGPFGPLVTPANLRSLSAGVTSGRDHCSHLYVSLTPRTGDTGDCMRCW